jgi:hypothetical protein
MGKMAKRPRNAEELEELLHEQLAFLENSAAAFDAGMDGEAKRLAVSLRVLLHDTNTSHSLLGQLGKKNVKFVDTALDFDPKNIVPYSGLVSVTMSGHVARLDDVPQSKKVEFDAWWNAPVFSDTHGQTLSRKDLVLTAANQDGGAHVDPELDEVYAKLTRDNSMGRFVGKNGVLQPLEGPERAAIRQIAHEILKTYKAGYEKKPQREDEMILLGMSASLGPSPIASPSQSPVRPRKIGRNEPCFCGSGKKYKRCHGAYA